MKRIEFLFIVLCTFCTLAAQDIVWSLVPSLSKPLPCTPRCIAQLEKEYAKEYGGDGQAVWLLEGQQPGEDHLSEVSRHQLTQDAAGQHLMVELDLFDYEHLAPYARRTIVYHLVEGPSGLLIDSVETPLTRRGIPADVSLQRRSRIPERCLSLVSMAEVNQSGEAPLTIVRHTSSPATGRAEQTITHRPGFISVVTRYPEADTLRTAYEKLLLPQASSSADGPVTYHTSSSVVLGGVSYTLEETFVFATTSLSAPAAPQLLCSERHLLGPNGHERTIPSRFSRFTTPAAALLRIHQLQSTFSEL